jgi:hypothetical protein
MTWICRECGDEVAGAEPFDAAWACWTKLDGNTGICPSCSRLAVGRADTSRIADTQSRLWCARRAVAKLRGLPDRCRRPRWDEALIEEAADRLGYAPDVCDACTQSDAPQCSRCDGKRIVWRRGCESICGREVLRRAMWPLQG